MSLSFLLAALEALFPSPAAPVRGFGVFGESRLSFARFFPRTKKASGREDLGFGFGFDPGRDGREVIGPREELFPKIEGVEEKPLAPVSLGLSSKSLPPRTEDEEHEEEESKQKDLLFRGINP